MSPHVAGAYDPSNPPPSGMSIHNPNASGGSTGSGSSGSSSGSIGHDSPGGDHRPPGGDRPDSGSGRPDGGHSGGDSGHDRPYGNGRPDYDHPDHRYDHPSCGYAHEHDYDGHRPPEHYGYTPYYTRWWVHPYYRYEYSTSVIVVFGYDTDPWDDYWVPPSRSGFIWVYGYWAGNYWVPGYWMPNSPAPRAGYVWVPGFWYQTSYVEGYYRPEVRQDAQQNWIWVDGYYLDDGTYVWGYWKPAFAGPQGYVWEPGFFDGENYVDGFWRPEFRVGYSWSGAFYDEGGVYHAGYWLPTHDRPGFVWVPGWFDGSAWQAGYWVSESEYANTDPNAWQAPAGWDGGWQVGEGWGNGAVLDNRSPAPAEPAQIGADQGAIEDGGYGDTQEVPLALPVQH